MRNFKYRSVLCVPEGTRGAAEIHVAVHGRFRIINESVADGGAYENPQTKGAGDFNKIGNSTACRQIRHGTRV